LVARCDVGSRGVRSLIKCINFHQRERVDGISSKLTAFFNLAYSS
jgi:hypothetical protein